MSTTETTVGTLTTDDVAALRMARSVTFTHYQGRAFIRAYVEPTGYPATFTRREQILFPETDRAIDRCREIPVTGRIRGYTDSGSMWHVDRDDMRATAFYMVHAARYVRTWVTIASLLTPGETVSLQWLADNNSDNVTAAGLHVDALELTATKGKRVRVFGIAEQVSPDNSARMIRRNG